MLKSEILHIINDLISQNRINKSVLADKCGVARPTLYNYLEGKTDVPLEVLLIICDLLGLELKIFNDDPLNKAMDIMKEHFRRFINQEIEKNAGKLK